MRYHDMGSITISEKKSVERTNRVDLKLHFVKKEASCGRIKLFCIRGDEKNANNFTKALGLTKFNKKRIT